MLNFNCLISSNISSEEMLQNKRNTQGWYEYNSLKRSILQPFQ